MLLGYDYHNAELDYVRIPDEDEDQIWYLRQIIDDWKENGDVKENLGAECGARNEKVYIKS